MKPKKKELPLVEPMYSTYHYQGVSTAVIAKNPSIRNFCLNNVMVLTCTRKFLGGFTTPELGVAQSSLNNNPHLVKKRFPMRYLGGYLHFVIRRLLDDGIYVCFSGVDDFYLPGKTFCGTRHFDHDGCICGYDTSDGTFLVYAYDKNWVYRTFRVPVAAFDAGRHSSEARGVFGDLCAVYPTPEEVVFSPDTALRKIAEYLDSDMKKYPESGTGSVAGTAVHDYMALYLDRLIDGSVPYERFDRRVFRLIWEQKKVMLERILKIEETLHTGGIGDAYKAVIREADNCRMLYAAHAIRPHPAFLPVIREKLLALKEREASLLGMLLEKTKGEKTE